MSWLITFGILILGALFAGGIFVWLHGLYYFCEPQEIRTIQHKIAAIWFCISTAIIIVIATYFIHLGVEKWLALAN